MGAKTWMIVYSDGNAQDALAKASILDRDSSKKLAIDLFPNETLIELDDDSLEWTCPPDNEIRIGCYPGVSIIAAKEFGNDYPSKTMPRFIEAGRSGNVTVHAMHSVVDWFAFAHWENGMLIRALSLSPDSGVIEDIGERLDFEQPYWSGQYPAVDEDDENDDYPLPFHPLDLGEAALKNFFGYQLEGAIDDSMLDPETIPLMSFQRRKSIWKFWK